MRRTGAGESGFAPPGDGCPGPPRTRTPQRLPQEVPAVSQSPRPSQLPRTPMPWGTRGCTRLALARRRLSRRRSAAAAPSRRPGAVGFRVAAVRPRGSCAQPDAALRAPAQPFPLRRRQPLAGGPSAWRHTWQLTGAVLRTRRGGGGGRAAGACRGPAAPGG